MRKLPSMMGVIFISVLAGSTLAGCATVKPYEKPALDAPSAWNAADAQAAMAPLAGRAAWWLDLKDPALNDLMTTAMASNLDLKAALARVDEARAMGALENTRYKPSFALAANVTGEGGQVAQGGVNTGDLRGSVGINGSWELDPYGLKRLEAQAAQAGVGAAQAQYRGAMNALLAEVAKAYLDLREQQQLQGLVLKNIDLENETARIIKIQSSAGAGTQLDVLRAQAQVEQTQSDLPNIKAAIQLDLNRISVLLGENPGSRDAQLKTAQTIPTFPGAIALDAPASVIAQRPDVQNAEQLLIQQGAIRNIRSADLFPKITLSGFFGLASSSYFGSSTPASLVGDLARPLLDYGRIQDQIKAQEARKQQAFYTYKQSMLLAIEDVERNLVVYGQETSRLQTLNKTADIQREVARQARLKYQAGDATFLDVLIAEQSLLDSELSAVQSKSKLSTAGVDLYTSLGGTPPGGQS